ncbi:hypothetical protein AAFC00_005436 [Neodothiora populina]|uniref:Uncharacterized protein n=1 Tax=Neodothiora populina TaxID=2781224 RepID=A0ABR3PLY6_9PEZI
MEHYKPHPSATFEGYYSKFKLPSGAHLALIICTVPGATKKPHMISFTYVPRDTSKIYQKELWVERLDMPVPSASPSGSGVTFEQHFPGGRVICHEDSTTEYAIANEHFNFTAKTKSRTPWSPSMSTPEGLLVYFPIPLHWHVQSLSSKVDFTLQIHDHEGTSLPQVDRSGKALVHQEKNWANSFPSAHIWVQARDEATNSGICIAGGQILGLEAYLLGYMSKNPCHSLTFRPPLAVQVGGWSPTMQATPKWEDRTFELSVQSWTQKLVVKARAPKGTFFGLSSPFAEGHRENFLGQSFEADITVEVWEAEGWLLGGWRKVQEEHFKRGSLEFGGAYYGQAGTEKRRN